MKLTKLEEKILDMLEGGKYRDCLGEYNNTRLAQDLAKLIEKEKKK